MTDTAAVAPAAAPTSAGFNANGGTEYGGKVTDDSSVAGRIKPSPVCLDSTLQKESMSAETLQQWVFSVDTVVPTNTNNSGSGWSRSSIASTGTMATIATAPLITTAPPESTAHKILPFASNISTNTRVPVSVVSISSNNSCGDHATLSSDEAKNSEEQLNAKVALRKTSRQGRSSQRWATTASPGEGVRLTTGCVPILRTGKILFVSASRKPAWILPKGGWEQDESMEESAIRECFEEAGCLGTLGPALAPIHYETRKAKKRRMDHEQVIQQHNKIAKTEPGSTTESQSVDEAKPGTDTEDTVATTKLPEEPSKNEDAAAVKPPEDPKKEYATISKPPEDPKKEKPSSLSIATAGLTDQAMSRIRGTASASASAGHHTDETMSVGSLASATYSHAQMTLFPLYVRKIEATWPESGRFRKAVDIDEAIEMLAERPELKTALQQVKERGLHLIQEQQQHDKNESTE